MEKSFICIIFYFSITHAYIFDDEKRLRNKLFHSYNIDIRPPYNHSVPLNVSVVFFIRSIQRLDDVSRIFTISGAFQSQWTDKRLQWNASEFANIQSIVVSSKDIWVPELQVFNAADDMYLDATHSFVLISDNGSLFWVQGTTIKATYKPNMTYFPYDTQTCKLQIYTTRYFQQEVFTFNALDKMDTSLYAENNEWHFVETSSVVYLSNSTTLVEFSITLRRKSLYYTLCMLVPIIILTLVNPLVFLLPYESGERVTFSVTMLLSFGIFFVQVKDYTPDISYPMPYMSYLILCAYGGSALATMLIILLNHIHHKKTTRPVPFLLHTVVRILSLRIVLDVCKSFCREKNSVEDIGDSSKDCVDTTKGVRMNCTWQSISRSLDMIFMTYAYITMFIFIIYRIFRAQSQEY